LSLSSLCALSDLRDSRHFGQCKDGRAYVQTRNACFSFDIPSSVRYFTTNSRLYHCVGVSVLGDKYVHNFTQHVPRRAISHVAFAQFQRAGRRLGIVKGLLNRREVLAFVSRVSAAVCCPTFDDIMQFLEPILLRSRGSSRRAFGDNTASAINLMG
jgi:hypothetical protein